jgi:hypothetical protein
MPKISGKDPRPDMRVCSTRVQLAVAVKVSERERDRRRGGRERRLIAERAVLLSEHLFYFANPRRPSVEENEPIVLTNRFDLPENSIWSATSFFSADAAPNLSVKTGAKCRSYE